MDDYFYKRCPRGHSYPSNGLYDGVCGTCEAEDSEADFYAYAGSDSPYWDLPTDHADDERRTAQGE